jgi:hypothetical protein
MSRHSCPSSGFVHTCLRSWQCNVFCHPLLQIDEDGSVRVRVHRCDGSGARSEPLRRWSDGSVYRDIAGQAVIGKLAMNWINLAMNWINIDNRGVAAWLSKCLPVYCL